MIANGYTAGIIGTAAEIASVTIQTILDNQEPKTTGNPVDKAPTNNVPSPKDTARKINKPRSPKKATTPRRNRNCRLY